MLYHQKKGEKERSGLTTAQYITSLRIKDRRTWKRYSTGKGGDTITFVQEFCGKDFREAVNYLLDFNGHRQASVRRQARHL